MPGGVAAPGTPRRGRQETHGNDGRDAAPGADRPAPRRGRGRLVWRNTVAGWSFILPNFIGFAVLTMVPVVGAVLRGVHQLERVPADRDLDRHGQLRAAAGTTDVLDRAVEHPLLHGLPHPADPGRARWAWRCCSTASCAAWRSSAPPRSSRTSPRSSPLTYVWNLLFSPEYGPINAFLRVHRGRQPARAGPSSADWSMPAVIIVGTWREMGYYMLLFLAGLQTIPAQLYEAARVDGANAWQRFWHVTLPGAAAHDVPRHRDADHRQSFKVFDLILLLTQGGPGQSTLVLSQYIYHEGLRGEPVRLRVGHLDRAVRDLLRASRSSSSGSTSGGTRDDRVDSRADRPSTAPRRRGHRRRVLVYARRCRRGRRAAAAVLLDGRVVAEDQQRRLHRPDPVVARTRSCGRTTSTSGGSPT